MAFDVSIQQRAWQQALGTSDVAPGNMFALVSNMQQLATKMLRADNDRREEPLLSTLPCDQLCNEINELARRVVIYSQRLSEVALDDAAAIEETVTAPLMRGDFSRAEMPESALRPGADISQQQPSDLGRIFVLANQVELRDDAEEFKWSELVDDFRTSTDEFLERAKESALDVVPGRVFGIGALVGLAGGVAGLYLIRRVVG